MSPFHYLRTRPSRTKIVATVGPACDDDSTIRQLIEAGVDVFRLNMAHGGPEQQQVRFERIRRVSRELKIPIAMLADLAGPKIRLGKIPGGSYECRPETPVHFVRGKSTDRSDTFTATYEHLIDELEIGDRIMLADGTVALTVREKTEDRVTCEVLVPGVVRSRQGVNLPGVKLSIPTLQPVDRENAVWATRAGIDFLGLSFVRSENDLHELRELVSSTVEEENAGRSEEEKLDIPHLVAKIEKPEALEHLEAIVRASDGIMVARGDLGVEIDVAEIAVVQKRIIDVCRRFRKPVIVATQMLDSMQQTSLPTRAEATDVANAILDGTDACMLSGETAIGKFPLRSVEMMHRIATATEPLLADAPSSTLSGDEEILCVDPITGAICRSAGELARAIDAALILVATQTGEIALSLAKDRHFVMTVGTSPSETTLRRMCLYWGVIPVGDYPTDSYEHLIEAFVRQARENGHLESQERIVMLTGLGTVSGQHNAVLVHQVD